MSIVQHPPGSTQPIADSLRALRGKITSWLLIDGISRFLICLLCVIAIDVLIDWQFNLDRPQRIAMLILAVIPLVLVAYRYLIKPFLTRLSDDALCLEIENRNQQMGESLISALQLARTDGAESQKVSQTLINATILKGVDCIEDIQVDQVINGTRLNVNRVLLVLSSIALVGLGVSVAKAAPMQTWFQRNILLSDQPWDSHTFFEFAGVRDGEIAVPFGSDWPLIVRMTSEEAELPASLDIDVRISDGGRRTERAERFEQDREFQVMLKRVTSQLEVRARAGRSRTDWYPVRVVTRPAIEELKLNATPPEYSGLPEQALPKGEGPYYVLKGTRLSVRGTINKTVASAALVSGENRYPMELSGDASFSLELDPSSVVADTYRIELEDVEEIWNPSSRTFVPLRSLGDSQFTLKYTPDLAPAVNAQLLGVGSMVLPKARIPYTTSISDDFGITASRIQFEWRIDEAGSETQKGTSEIELPESAIGDLEFAFDDAIDLAELEIPEGSGFGFEIEADDNDEVSGRKTGKSAKFLLRVVSEEELRENLLRREKELRQEFESILKRQEDVLTDSEALRATLNTEEEVSAEERKMLMESQRSEKQMTTGVLSIADRLEAIITEIQNNRIEEEGGPSEQRLGRQIIAPMRRLGSENLPSITNALDQVRRQLAQTSERDEALDSAIDEQRQAVDSMKEILSQMIKSEGFQEAVNLLHQVQQEQRDVADMTEKEKRERLERILNQTE
ncbi:MAG: hypothetical protein AAGG48_24525 [Planctomycetota bacterium]